jgi:hypothetical protein
LGRRPGAIAAKLGLAGFVGFGILFFGRIAQEERMMLEALGSRYQEYMARTYRVIPLIF